MLFFFLPLLFNSFFPPKHPSSCCFVYGLISTFVHAYWKKCVWTCSGQSKVTRRYCFCITQNVIVSFCGRRRDTTSVFVWCVFVFFPASVTHVIFTDCEWRMFISGICCFSEPVRSVANGQIRCYSVHDCGTEKTKMTSRCSQLRSPSPQFVCVTTVML